MLRLSIQVERSHFVNTLIIDIGTSSMRGILFTETGQKLAVSQVAYRVSYPGDGRVEQDALELRHTLVKIVKDVVEAAEQGGHSIDQVATTAQRSSIMAVGRDGTPLTPFIMWQDTRNRDICERLKADNREIFEHSGSYVNAVFSGSKMAWIRENLPDIHAKTFKFPNIPEYLMHTMTGEYRTDYTYGSRSNLMNLRECRWDPELLRLFGLEESKLCELREPGSILGTVTSDFARETGLPAGIPVRSCGGDQQCAAVGQGAFREGVVSIVTGTGAYMITTVGQVPADVAGKLICNAASVPGKYILEASVLACCSAFDWFRRSFYPEPDDFDRIAAELEDQYGKETRCIALPYFQGRSTPDWNAAATASFHNVTLSTTRQEMLSALLTAIFLEIRNNMDNMRSYVDIQRGYISGGLTRTPVINQMHADALGFPLDRMEDSESTAIGALMIALTACGACDTLDDAFRTIRSGEKTDTYLPNAEKHRRCCEIQQRMNALYRAQQ